MSVDPGEGYRLLREGEKILETDQFWGIAIQRWINTSTLFTGDTYSDKKFWAMRRKIHGRQVHLYTTCNDLGVINGASVYASELPIPFENVVEIKVDPSTGTLYVEDWHGRPSGEA